MRSAVVVRVKQNDDVAENTQPANKGRGWQTSNLRGTLAYASFLPTGLGTRLLFDVLPVAGVDWSMAESEFQDLRLDRLQADARVGPSRGIV